MSAFHVTGVSGSGKSSVAVALMERGYRAVDADADARLAMWVDKYRMPVREPVKDDGWMSRYWWVWNPRRLDELLADSSSSIFICGNAANENRLRDRFAQQFLLVVDEPTMLTRLASASRCNEYGSTDDERAMLRDFRGPYQQRKLAGGAIPIDANRSLDAVVNTLIEACGIREA